MIILFGDGSTFLCFFASYSGGEMILSSLIYRHHKEIAHVDISRQLKKQGGSWIMIFRFRVF